MVLPVKGAMAKLEAAWATRIPELDMEVDMLDARTLDRFWDEESNNQNLFSAFFCHTFLRSARTSASIEYEYEKVHVRLQKRRYLTCTRPFSVCVYLPIPIPRIRN